LLEDGTYKMWFRSGPSGDSSIGYAESLDGIEWTLSPDNPVLTPGRMRYGYLPLAFKKHQRPEADIIFHHGVVLTMEANPAQVQAIAIRGSRILAVGSNAAILALGGASTEVIDLGGRTLLPGFADGHTHVLRRKPEAWTLDETVDLLLGFGLTSVTEMSGSDDSVAELLTAESEGRLRLRVNVFPSYNLAWLDEEGQSIYEGAWFPEHGPILDSNRRVRIPGIKIFADGAGVAPRGCPAMTIPYPYTNTACFHEDGDLYLSQADLNQAVADLQGRGFRVAFHTMGDRGIDTVLTAIENALGGASNSIYRHQIEHSSFLRPDQIDSYAALDILSSVRGTWNVCDQEEYETDWPDHYTQWVNRFALPGRGIHAYAEGDFGWNNPDPYDRTGIYTTVDPLMMLWGLVTRQQLDGDGSTCTPDPWVAEHQISVDQALRMLTIEPAYAVSQETVLGSLKAGKFADMVILSGNPKTVEPDSLKDLDVLMTMVGGDTEYCEAGYEALCP
ncbi:MAG TPA: amidohydrolase family protein, partial [Anaerolineae bacterium]|nr:amidohydrolase family protein [Anaerolineae bacterium]